MKAIDHKYFDHVGIMEVSLGGVISEREGNINSSLEIEKISELLDNFYKSLQNDADYFLISLYIPTIVVAVTANLIVITVVIKYQHMRRYFSCAIYNLKFFFQRRIYFFLNSNVIFNFLWTLGDFFFLTKNYSHEHYHNAHVYL